MKFYDITKWILTNELLMPRVHGPSVQIYCNAVMSGPCNYFVLHFIILFMVGGNQCECVILQPVKILLMQFVDLC